MLLHEIYQDVDSTEYQALLEETKQIQYLFEEMDLLEVEFLEEGIGDLFSSIKNVVTLINQSKGRKNPVNDGILNKLYNTELANAKTKFNQLPNVVRPPINKFFSKVGIKLQGIDMSRTNYLSRFFMLKFANIVMALAINAIENKKQDLIFTLLGVIAPQVSVVLNMAANSTDYIELASKSIQSIRQIGAAYTELSRRANPTPAPA